jgi:hypothetical protein
MRAAVLALLREVAPGAVYRTCGISLGQVLAWKARSAKAPDVRVFSVVEEEGEKAVPRLAAGATASAAAPELELRLGPWSVSVRLAGRG